MERHDAQQLKTELERTKQEIEEKLRGLERVTDFGNDVDPDQETSETEALANQLSVAQVLKERLGTIEIALQKFDENRYGVCEGCGKEISPEVLRLVPESRLCQNCKKNQQPTTND